MEKVCDDGEKVGRKTSQRLKKKKKRKKRAKI